MTLEICPSLESRERLFSMLGKSITAIEHTSTFSNNPRSGYLPVAELIFTLETDQTFFFQANGIDISGGDEAFVVEVDPPHPVTAYPNGPSVERCRIVELEMFVGARIDDLRTVSANWIITADQEKAQSYQDDRRLLGKNPRWFVLISSEEAKTLDSSYHIEDGVLLHFTNSGVMLVQASLVQPLNLDVWYWPPSEQK